MVSCVLVDPILLYDDVFILNLSDHVVVVVVSIAPLLQRFSCFVFGEESDNECPQVAGDFARFFDIHGEWLKRI